MQLGSRVKWRSRAADGGDCLLAGNSVQRKRPHRLVSSAMTYYDTTDDPRDLASSDRFDAHVGALPHACGCGYACGHKSTHRSGGQIR